MSEEEIIKEFKNLIYNSDFDYIKLMDEDGFTGWHELFENILDLYNKEKEKNVKLKKDKQILYGVIDEIKEERDKIRDIIKKSSYPDFAIQKIEELLGE